MTPPYFFIFNIQFNCNHYISLVMLCGRKSTKSGVTPLKRCSGKIVSGLIYLSIRCCPVNSLSSRITLPLFLGIVSFWDSSRIVHYNWSSPFSIMPLFNFFHLLMVVCNILTVQKCSFLRTCEIDITIHIQ